MGFVARACLSIRAGSTPGSGGLSRRTASQLADPALRNAQQHRRIADRKLRGEAPEELRGLAGDLSGGALLLAAVLAEALPLDQERVLEWRVWLAFWGSAATSARLQAEQHRRYREWRGLLKRVLAAAQQDGQLSASIDLDRVVDQIVALVDGFGLQGVLDPQHPQPEQLASRLNGAVDALICAAEV
jgi:hypothetical protein